MNPAIEKIMCVLLEKSQLLYSLEKHGLRGHSAICFSSLWKLCELHVISAFSR